MQTDDDRDLRELEALAEEIHNGIARTHLNLRVVWIETLVPTIEGIRRAARCTNPECRAARERALEALREFAQSL